jgi:hypothetical protein
MNSSKNKISRGFVDKNVDLSNYGFDKGQIINMLSDKYPVNRTIGVRIVGQILDDEYIPELCSALEIEKKLYPKIEICETLIKFGEKSVPYLINLLGEIGNNQHKTVPSGEFKKKSYPLPRDIAARTISKIGIVALDYLLQILEKEEPKKISEALDAIGYICFYNNNSIPYNQFKKLYLENKYNDLLKWKVIRTLEAFSDSEVFLKELLNSEKDERLKNEIQRSINQLKRS